MSKLQDFHISSCSVLKEKIRKHSCMKPINIAFSCCLFTLSSRFFNEDTSRQYVVSLPGSSSAASHVLRFLYYSLPSLPTLNPFSLSSFSHSPPFLFYLSFSWDRCVIKTHYGHCWRHVKGAVQWLNELCWMVPIIFIDFHDFGFDNVCQLQETVRSIIPL